MHVESNKVQLTRYNSKSQLNESGRTHQKVIGLDGEHVPQMAEADGRISFKAEIGELVRCCHVTPVTWNVEEKVVRRGIDRGKERQG